MAYQSKYKGKEVEDILDNALLKKEQSLTDNEKKVVKENLGIKDPDLSEYYTKEETEQKIKEGVSSIVIPEDESIKNVTEDEYNAMFEANTLSDKTMYFVSKDGSPIALYIGKVQIAVREESSKGFAYNFPIIF